MKRHVESELRPDNHRMENFSDAVFAIVVTIMVLEIRIPDSLAFGDDRAALHHFLSYIGTYSLSFLVIANLWTSHHYLLFTVHKPARSTLWCNSLLLFTVTLVPVATRFLGMHPMSPRAAAIYGFVAALCTTAFMLLRWHAARITRNEVHRGIHHRVIRRTWVILAIYLVSIPLAYVNIWLAWACFVIVPPMLFLPVIRGPARSERTAEEHALEHSCP